MGMRVSCSIWLSEHTADRCVSTQASCSVLVVVTIQLQSHWAKEMRKQSDMRSDGMSGDHLQRWRRQSLGIPAHRVTTLLGAVLDMEFCGC